MAAVTSPGRSFDGRPLWAEIDLDALAHNLAALRSRIPATTSVCAVVKANAYGHGASICTLALESAGSERFAVATVDEGVQLREAGVAVPILLLSGTPLREIQRAVNYRLTPTLMSQQAAIALSRLAADTGAAIKAHIKVDTGMHRFGLAPDQAIELARMAAALPGVEIEGLYTHLATADEADKEFTHRQIEAFTNVAGRLPEISLRHVANSAAIIDVPESVFNMVRPGIALYGIYPSESVAHEIDLRPVMALRAELMRSHELEPGDAVSYGRTWSPTEKSIIGLVPCGYADGYRRGLSNRGHMIVGGRRVPVRGRVTMDQTMVDLSEIGPQPDGTTVTIYGRDGDQAILVEEVARLEETIPYEITCAVSARVPRIAMRGGAIVQVQTLNG